MVRFEEPEGLLIGNEQMGQGDARIQAAALLAAPDMDGIALMGEVPGLAVDGGGGQAGGFQSGVGLVRDLLHGFALEALQIVAQLVALGGGRRPA